MRALVLLRVQAQNNLKAFEIYLKQRVAKININTYNRAYRGLIQLPNAIPDTLANKIEVVAEIVTFIYHTKLSRLHVYGTKYVQGPKMQDRKGKRRRDCNSQ